MAKYVDKTTQEIVSRTTTNGVDTITFRDARKRDLESWDANRFSVRNTVAPEAPAGETPREILT